MAQFQVLNPLAQISGLQGTVSQGQTIRQQRQANQLQELLQPYQMKQAEMKQRQMQGQLSDDDRMRLGRDSMLYIEAFGDMGEVPPPYEEANKRHLNALGAMKRAGIDISAMPQEFDPAFYDQSEALAIEAQRFGSGQSKYQFGASEVVKTDDGLMLITQRRDPRTGKVETVSSPVSGEFVNKMGLTAEGQVEQKGKEARATRGAEAEVDLATRPGIEAAVVRSKESAKREEQRSEAARTLEDLQGSLDRMRSLTEEGIYTGAIGDKFAQGLASAGIILDQDRLNRTTRVRQIATNLKFMAKPAGMGAMSDSEWGIIRDAIPDPDSATAGQLLAGLEEFERRLQERAGISSGVPRAGGGEISTPEQAASAGWSLMTDANGNQAYVSPDGQFIEVK